MRGAADAAGRVGRRTVGGIYGAGAAGGVRRERGRRGDGDLDGEIVPGLYCVRLEAADGVRVLTVVKE